MPDGGAGETKKSEAPAAIESEAPKVAEPELLVSPAVGAEPAINQPTPAPEAVLTPVLASAAGFGNTAGLDSAVAMTEAQPADLPAEQPIAQAQPGTPPIEQPRVPTVIPHPLADLVAKPVSAAGVAPSAAARSPADTAVIDVTHGGELAVRWIGVIDQIGLTGMTYNIAANASLRSVEAGCWSFALTNQQIHLFNATHQQRLGQALSDHFGDTVRVEVVEAPAQGETPAEYQQRKRQERQVQAVQAIENDPNVQAIIANYDARIDLASIQPIDNGELVK